MSDQFIRKSYGILGGITEVFNAVGACARSVNNIASGTAEFTDDLPRLGNVSGRLMTAKAEKALSDQQSLLEQS